MPNCKSWENVHPPPCVTCCVSHVTCHMPRFMSQVSQFFFFQSHGASCWRVCYQRGLPYLVNTSFQYISPKTNWPFIPLPSYFVQMYLLFYKFTPLYINLPIKLILICQTWKIYLLLVMLVTFRIFACVKYIFRFKYMLYWLKITQKN